MNTEIIKAPTKQVIEKLISERGKKFEDAIPVLVEKCIGIINTYLENNVNWGNLKRLNYGSSTVQISFDIFMEYKNIDPMYDLPYEVKNILDKKLDEAGYHVFSSTGGEWALYFSLTPKEVKQ